MKTNDLLILVCILIFTICCTIGCTTAGSKFIKINYLGQNNSVITSANKHVGFAPFLDKRGDIKKGYIGKRILNSGQEEIYFVDGLDIASTVTQSFVSYFNENGYICSTIKDFNHNVESLKKADKKYKYILTGDINVFEFFATKGFTTSMVLNIKLVVYLGDVESGVFTTIPVTLNLERKDLQFSEESVERFINESLTEVIIKAVKQEIYK